MARGKGKKTPSKGKRKAARGGESETSSSSIRSNNVGPVAGIAALVILLVAIFLRPSNETSSLHQSNAIVENATMERPNDVTSDDEEEEIEPVTPNGFYLNAFHDIHTVPPNKEDLLQYLKYDDGYSVCLRKDDLGLDEYGVWHLKQLKLKYLEFIANHEAHWIAESPLARRATCRILTLIHDDFDAVSTFQQVMKRNDKDEIVKFTLDRVNDASEYRTIVCLSRLTDHMVNQEMTPVFHQVKYSWGVDGMTAKETAEKIKPRLISQGWMAKPDKASSFHYYENGPYATWIRPTVRPGEVGTMPLGKQEKKSSLVVRKNPCPLENSKPLLDESYVSI